MVRTKPPQFRRAPLNVNVKAWAGKAGERWKFEWVNAEKRGETVIEERGGRPGGLFFSFFGFIAIIYLRY